MKLDPKYGGCLFCSIYDRDLIFSTKLNAYIHIDCMMTHLRENPDVVLTTLRLED